VQTPARLPQSDKPGFHAGLLTMGVHEWNFFCLRPWVPHV